MPFRFARLVVAVQIPRTKEPKFDTKHGGKFGAFEAAAAAL